ncbi:MAG: retron St85 family RNA-directed DNA polymerase [Treponema sp.]
MGASQHLKLRNLPVFSSLEELASLVHIDRDTLFNIVYYTYKFYRIIPIAKKNGGFRTIFIPNKTVKAIQSWILRMILDTVSPSSYATGFRKKYTIKNNVFPHRYNRYFLKVDIKDFFPSISKGRVTLLFKQIGYDTPQAVLLAKICTCRSILPQGGVTSPAISNLVVNMLDRRISSLCSKKNIIYTRYADDFTFSSNNRNILNSIQPIIIRIIENEGYTVNKTKIKFSGPKIHCRVTGLVKNSSEPSFGIGRKNVYKIRHIIFDAIINKQFKDKKYSTIESIKGVLAYYKFINKDTYSYLYRYILHLNPDNDIFCLKQE